MQTLVKGSVFSLLGTNPLRTTGGPTDHCGVKHGSPHQGPALTQAHSVEGPPTPTWCSKTPALHLGHGHFAARTPKTPPGALALIHSAVSHTANSTGRPRGMVHSAAKCSRLWEGSRKVQQEGMLHKSPQETRADGPPCSQHFLSAAFIHSVAFVRSVFLPRAPPSKISLTLQGLNPVPVLLERLPKRFQSLVPLHSHRRLNPTLTCARRVLIRLLPKATAHRAIP